MPAPRGKRNIGLDVRLAKSRATVGRCCFCLNAPSVERWGDLVGWCRACATHLGRLVRPPLGEEALTSAAPIAIDVDPQPDPLEVARLCATPAPTLSADLVLRYRAEFEYGLARWQNVRQALSHAQAVVEVMQYRLDAGAGSAQKDRPGGKPERVATRRPSEGRRR